MWALTKEEMKNCVWLNPELVAQIEFTEWTPDGHLRHSRFVGLREDQNPKDVTREQAPRSRSIAVMIPLTARPQWWYAKAVFHNLVAHSSRIDFSA
jgi:ATP-dependent DNA ligase